MNTTNRRTVRITAMLAALLCAAPWTSTGARAAEPNPRVSVNARNVSLGDLAAIIADQSGINMTVDGMLANKKATVRLQNVPLQTALRAIESSYGVSGAWSDGVLHIGTADTILRGYPSAGSIEQRSFTMHYADPNFAASSLQNTLPAGTIIIPDQRSNTVLVKGTPETLAAAKQMIASMDKTRLGAAGFSTQLVPVSNLRASDALSIIRTSIGSKEGETVAATDHPNALVVTGPPDFVGTVKAMLFNVDRPGRQVRFKVRVTDITPINTTSNIGVLWGGPPAQGATSGGSGPVNPGNASAFTALTGKSIALNAQLNFLQTQAKATILAEPDISTLDNEKATLNIGEQYPITFFNPQTGQNQVQFINAGVDLTITPIIGNNGDVTVTLDTDYSQILSFVGTYPIVGQRHVVNVLRVGSDETIVIAGLFQDVTNETVQKVPILGDIPIIGQVFRNRAATHTRDEIVFLITPHILNDGDFHPASEIPAEPK